MDKKVDFIVIGPGKSGTSWMYNVLLSHDEVCLSNSKETLYFEKYYNKGEKWFHDFFKECQTGKVSGEISNTYIFNKDVPGRIKLYRDDIKIVCSLRNPIERTFSHYLYMLKVGEERGSFDEVLNKRPDLIHRGSYYKLLSEYDKYFDKSQIKVLLFENLKEDPSEFAREFFDFLGISHSVEKEIIEERVLPAGGSRNYYLSKAVSTAAHLARDFGMAQLVSKLKFNKKVTSLLYRKYDSENKPKLSLEQKLRLRDLFYKDVNLLSTRLGKDMVKFWNFDEIK